MTSDQMRGLVGGRRGTWLLLLALLLPWSAIFVLHLSQLAQGQFVHVPPIVYSDPAPGEYPTILKVVRDTPASEFDLQAGDRVIRVGDEDVRGHGFLGFSARLFQQCAPCERMPVLVEREGRRLPVGLEVKPFSMLWRVGGVVVALCYAVFGALILLRAPPGQGPRLLAIACLLFSASTLPFFAGSLQLTYAYVVVSTAIEFVMQPLILFAADAVMRAHVPAGTRPPYWAWLFSASGLVHTSGYLSWPLSHELGWELAPLANIVFISVLIGWMGRRYLQADAEGRRKFKWIVYGIVFGTLPTLLANLAIWLDPSLEGILDYNHLATALIPICLFIATVRHRLFDIDRLISATATYSVLVVVVLAGLLALAPKLAHAASAATGLAAPTVQTLLSFAIACLILPGQKVLRPWLDHLFFRERRALETGMDELLAGLSACEHPRALFELAGEQLDLLLRPESCAIYARTGDAFAPVFARAAVVPPAFAVDGDLARRLHGRRIPLGSERGWGRRHRDTDSESLQALGALLVLPVHHHGALAGFVCLGHKRSGDVYINTDLALLTAVAERISVELQRFDIAEVRRQAEGMQAALRRYVPGAVAEHLEQGKELEAAEREVTVLFVDIRGYTTYSEPRSATEIFDTVNRYTQAVSAIVRRRGGTIIEFNGDGLMVIFGAPQALPGKENAAVAAAREVVAGVRALALGTGREVARGLDVGVGIATGLAYVGNIRAVDRMIWGAIGNTTNLAARLQGLSRDLRCSIVIDAATFEAAAEAAAGFEPQKQVQIRGRTQRENIYCLRL